MYGTRIAMFIENFMADNKNYTGMQDRVKVDGNDPAEVEYLHSQFPELTHEQVKAAIEESGPERKKILEHLKKKYRIP